jgi:hypothetical protein
VDDTPPQTEIRWRTIDGTSRKTRVPAGAAGDYPLYIRRTDPGWSVCHAPSGLAIRTLPAEREATRFLFAIENIVDWRLPAAELIARNPYLVARLAEALTASKGEVA